MKQNPEPKTSVLDMIDSAYQRSKYGAHDIILLSRNKRDIKLGCSIRFKFHNYQ